MSKTRRPLSERESLALGSWLNEQLGEGPGPETLSAQRLRLARTAVVPERRSARFWAVGGGALAAAVMAGGVLLLGKWRSEVRLADVSRQPGISAEPLSSVRERGVEVAESLSKSRSTSGLPTWRLARGPLASTASVTSASVRPGQWLDAAREEVALELSGPELTNRGRLNLTSGARARIVTLQDAALAVELERGVARAVVSERGTQLVVDAGPYAVRAASATAQYDVDWSPGTKTLKVQVAAGEVEVVETSTPGRRLVQAGGSLNLPDGARLAPAPDTLRVARKTRIEGAAAPQIGAVRDDRGETQPGAPSSTSVEPNVETSAAEIQNVDSGRWRKFAENGQYTAAVKEAEQIGFGALEQTASASDLLLLADVARLGGAPQRARGVLLSLRSRFAGHTNAATAAFTLGRMAQEQEHDDRRAMQWYRTYLKEEPQGRMAEGARARLLKAALRVGSPAEKEQAARDYLARHPTGSSAAVARGVLSK